MKIRAFSLFLSPLKTENEMEILITNDDGYRAKGIKVLAEMMKQFGNITVIAPKHHQSGMSMAVSLGLKPVAYKRLSEEWSYLDATPASCVKYGLNIPFLDRFPDVVVSGINHGSNASTASCYSGTLGAAAEAALNGVPAIGVSLDTINPDADFSAVTEFFPGIFRMIMDNLPERKGIYYNINFPDIPASQIKGIKVGHQGYGRWVREFMPWNPAVYAKYGITPETLGQSSNPEIEDGETLYMMVGDYVDGEDNDSCSDHWITRDGYISVVAHNIDTTDREETARLGGIL